MNRSITLVGVAILLVGIALIASPIVLTGVESFTTPLEIGVFFLPFAFTVILWGGASPDPNLTTVGGVFGNPDEDLLRRRAAAHRKSVDVRYLPGPRESVNCSACYTVVPWDAAECSRCGRRRECRGCGRPLFFLTGTVRCLPCVRAETFCNCPAIARKAATVVGRTVRR